MGPLWPSAINRHRRAYTLRWSPQRRACVALHNYNNSNNSNNNDNSNNRDNNNNSPALEPLAGCTDGSASGKISPMAQLAGHRSVTHENLHFGPASRILLPPAGRADRCKAAGGGRVHFSAPIPLFSLLARRPEFISGRGGACERGGAELSGQLCPITFGRRYHRPNHQHLDFSANSKGEEQSGKSVHWPAEQMGAKLSAGRFAATEVKYSPTAPISLKSSWLSVAALAARSTCLRFAPSFLKVGQMQSLSPSLASATIKSGNFCLLASCHLRFSCEGTER